MWILSFVPDSFLHLVVMGILFSGIGMYVLSFFTRFVPPLIPYSELVRIVGTGLFASGIYFYGSYSTEMSWRGRVNELEDKVAASEQRSKDNNVQIKTVYVDRVKVVKDTKVIIQEKIVNVASKIDAKCEVVPDALDILNEAAKNPKAKK